MRPKTNEKTLRSHLCPNRETSWATLRCKMGHIARQYQPFYTVKWAILQADVQGVGYQATAHRKTRAAALVPFLARPRDVSPQTGRLRLPEIYFK